MTRSSATQAVLRDPVDHIALPATKRLVLFVERRFDVRLEPFERLLVPTDEPTVDRVVCDIQRERLNIREIDERRVFPLDIAGEETPLFEPFVVGEVIGEFDGEVKVRGTSRLTGDPRPEHHRELDSRVGTNGLTERIKRH